MKQLSKILFAFFVVFSSVANAATEFDPFYTFTIPDTYSHVHAFSIVTNKWTAATHININNGLCAVIRSYWLSEAQAKPAISMHYTGDVNIIYTPSYECKQFTGYWNRSVRNTFSLVFQNKDYSKEIDSLYLNSYAPQAI